MSPSLKRSTSKIIFAQNQKTAKWSKIGSARIFTSAKLKYMTSSRISYYSGDPVSDRFTKRTILEYGPPFFIPKYFSIHILYYHIQRADRPAIRDTDHPFSVPNRKRTRKTDQQKNHTCTVIYALIKGPAVAGFTNRTSCSWIH